ncbi:MAG: hypothetical protein QOC85_3625 [Streptomyces sp.]|nr:hypothetical protein [Streptomyces sp.]
MPGTVLLLAASPVGKGCLVDAASVLPVLAAVAPSVLSGTDTANVVELADPLEPQAVLTRLRAAATAPGPLTVYLAGQLQLDRRQHLPHLALARTTPSTVRYTAFPWHWVREELRLRPPGTTTFFADLHADADAWQHLVSHPLTAGPGVTLYGRIAPPPPRRAVATPSYMKALATLLRSGQRPAPAQLHQHALTRAWGEGEPAGMVLAAEAQVPAASDPHAVITAAVQAGRHGEAAALAAQWEQSAVRAYGPGSGQALHWMEVRADLAMFAGDPVLSCRVWLAVAAARLGAGESPDTPAVESAVDRAHHQWGSIRDAARARELGPALADLRHRVPGRREGALRHIRQHLDELGAAQLTG